MLLLRERRRGERRERREEGKRRDREGPNLPYANSWNRHCQ